MKLLRERERASSVLKYFYQLNILAPRSQSLQSGLAHREKKISKQSRNFSEDKVCGSVCVSVVILFCSAPVTVTQEILPHHQTKL